MQRLEDHRRVVRPGAVVEGQHDFVVAQEIVLLEMLEAEGGAAGGVDLDDARRDPCASGLSQAGSMAFVRRRAAIRLAAAGVGAGGRRGRLALRRILGDKRIGAAVSSGTPERLIVGGVGACDGLGDDALRGLRDGCGAAAGAVVRRSVGDTTREASARATPDPVALCAATTPKAARPKVTNAAMTMTTTRIVPSAHNPTDHLLKVKAQSAGKSMRTRSFGRRKDYSCGFRGDKF